MTVVNINTFMTDITHVYYNSWISTMGSISLHLFCSWHIDRAWQQNLTKVKDIDERSQVYKTLKHLQTLLSEEEFEKQLHSFLNMLLTKDSTREMYIYLKNYYYDNREKWAYCYRKKRGINTNMFLENMHKIIKYEYMDGKKVKRLDKTLHALQKFVTDKTVSRLIKVTKGHTSKHLIEIKKRHRNAMCSSDLKMSVSDNCFIFHRKKDENPYLVYRQKDEDVCCGLTCRYCNICWHTYECTCLDYVIKNMICKHIHFVRLKDLNDQPVSNFLSKEEQSKELDMLVENLNSSSHVSNNSIVSDTEKKKILVKNAALSLTTNLDNKHYTSDEYDFMLKNLKVLNSLKTNSILPECEYKNRSRENKSVSLEPANKKLVKLTFTSTKKKRHTNNNRIAKPNLEEKQSLRESLSHSLYHDHQYII